MALAGGVKGIGGQPFRTVNEKDVGAVFLVILGGNFFDFVAISADKGAHTNNLGVGVGLENLV